MRWRSRAFRKLSTTARYRPADPGEGTCDERRCDLRLGCTERLASHQHCDCSRGGDRGQALVPRAVEIGLALGLVFVVGLGLAEPVAMALRWWRR